jgi:hypothetical protein
VVGLNYICLLIDETKKGQGRPLAESLPCSSGALPVHIERPRFGGAYDDISARRVG